MNFTFASWMVLSLKKKKKPHQLYVKKWDLSAHWITDMFLNYVDVLLSFLPLGGSVFSTILYSEGFFIAISSTGVFIYSTMQLQRFFSENPGDLYCRGCPEVGSNVEKKGQSGGENLFLRFIGTLLRVSIYVDPLWEWGVPTSQSQRTTLNTFQKTCHLILANKK